MANASYKKLRRNKIEAQLKEQKIAKLKLELRDAFMSMTDEDWDKLAEDLKEKLDEGKGEEN